MPCIVLLYRDEVGVLEQVSGTSVTALVHEQIQEHVETTCKGNFETAYLESVEKVSNWWISFSLCAHDVIYNCRVA